jgi:hypothetical protein
MNKLIFLVLLLLIGYSVWGKQESGFIPIEYNTWKDDDFQPTHYNYPMTRVFKYHGYPRWYDNHYDHHHMKYNGEADCVRYGGHGKCHHGNY